MTEVSIVIPTFNSIHTLIPCLKSLERSDFKKENFEVIIIDDGSTDDTEKQIDEFKRHSLLNIEYHKRVRSNRYGPGIARGYGFDTAQGKIIATTDADCIIDGDWVSKIYKAIIEDGNDVITGKVYSKDLLIFPWRSAPAGHRVTANMAGKKECIKSIPDIWRI